MYSYAVALNNDMIIWVIIPYSTIRDSKFETMVRRAHLISHAEMRIPCDLL